MKKEQVYKTLNEAYFSENCHEKTLLNNLPRFLKHARIFVDAGASLGQYTKLASEHMNSGRILAIEADPIRYEELQRNATIWSQRSSAKIESLFAAVSNCSGSITFHTTNSNVSGGLFPHAVRDTVQWEELKVPSVTLDELFPQDVPDFIKADIEGAELRMLQGATRILEYLKTIFLLEIHGWEDPEHTRTNTTETVNSYMRKHGYLPVSFYGHTLFMPFGLDYLKEKLAAGKRKYLSWL